MSPIIHMWPDRLAVETSNGVSRVANGRLLCRESFEPGQVLSA